MPNDRGSRRDPSRGRVPFIWVEDDDTGHRYDVPENAIRRGMTPVDNYPLNYTGKARTQKYRTNLAVSTPVQPVADEPSGDAVATRNASAKKKEASS